MVNLNIYNRILPEIRQSQTNLRVLPWQMKIILIILSFSFRFLAYLSISWQKPINACFFKIFVCYVADMNYGQVGIYWYIFVYFGIFKNLAAKKRYFNTISWATVPRPINSILTPSIKFFSVSICSIWMFVDV